METKFQTSFIPKKPLPPIGGVGSSLGGLPKPVPHGSIFFSLGVLLFIISIGALGVVFAWKTVLQSNQKSYKEELVAKEKEFNPILIRQLKQTNVKIDTAEKLLARHVALSNIFDIVSKMTSENVRFLSMNASMPLTDGQAVTSPDIKISLSGYGTSLSAVAFQAKVLSQLENYGLKSIVKNPVVGDPSFEGGGAVSFGFTATVEPTTLIYMRSMSGESTASSTNQ